MVHVATRIRMSDVPVHVQPAVSNKKPAAQPPATSVLLQPQTAASAAPQCVKSRQCVLAIHGDTRSTMYSVQRHAERYSTVSLLGRHDHTQWKLRAKVAPLASICTRRAMREESNRVRQ